MPFTKMGEFTFDHSDQQDDLYKVKTAAEVKAALDSRGNELKIALNQLIDELQSTTANNSGADKVKATPFASSPDTVQGILEWLKTQVDNTALGQIPDGSVTTIKLSDEFKAQLSNVNSILQREILRIKMRQTGLNLDPNVWSDSLEDLIGINTGLSSNYVFDNTNKSLKVNLTYTEDLCVGGTAISSGYYSELYPPEKAFDNSYGTSQQNWLSSQTGAGVNGVAYIGYDFGSAKTIKKVRYVGDSTASQVIPTAILQYWDGATWLDAQTLSIVATGTKDTWQEFLIDGTFTGTKWRLFANSNNTDKWSVMEIEMMEEDFSPAIVVWNPQISEGTLTKAIVEALENLDTGSITYEISRDGGTIFTSCTLDTVTDISTQPTGTSIVLKVIMTGKSELLSVAWGGSV